MINFNELRAELRSDRWTKKSFETLSKISNVCSLNMDIGRELVIRALENKHLLDTTSESIINELAMLVGLYQYATDLDGLSLKSALLHAAHRADGEMEDFILHSAQARVLRRLMAGDSVILSAPTSFGKSLLIDIVISAKDFNNIVLIVPTLALVEETRRRMSRFIDRYSIITSSNQSFGENNIFVLTQERFLAMESNIPRAVAGAECNTVTGLRREPHDAWPSARS